MKPTAALPGLLTGPLIAAALIGGLCFSSLFAGTCRLQPPQIPVRWKG
jgi:hypothetical protein